MKQQQPSPSRVDLDRAVSDTKEVARISNLGPSRSVLESEFGKATVEGREWRVPITREEWPVEKNRARLRRYNDMLAKKRAAQDHRSKEVSARRNLVRVRGPEGVIREIPVEQEHIIAAKHGFHAVRSGRPNAFEAEDGTLIVNGVPTGHTHMGEPHDWQRSSCPGCAK